MSATTRQLEMSIRQMRVEIDRLKTEMSRRPIRSGSSNPVYILQIIGGNTLADGSTTGVNYVDSAITSVPSAYDPDVDTTFIDGIGNAYLYVDGNIQFNKVLVVNDTRNGLFNSVMITDDIFLTNPTPVTIQVGTGPTNVRVWIGFSP